MNDTNHITSDTFPRARIFKLLWSAGIDSKEPIPPDFVAWRAGTITLSFSVPSSHKYQRSILVRDYSGMSAT
jgi:hypothetical protein